MNLKPALNYNEQINLLESRGLTIPDKDFARKVLSNVNYYALTGYLLPYRKMNDDYESVNFNLIYQQYQFDSELRSIVLSGIEVAERALKTKIAYQIAHDFNDCCLVFDKDNEEAYFSGDKFWVNDGVQRHLESILYKAVKTNSPTLFVSHHLKQYEGHFPIWVIIELFSLGNIRHIYENLKPMTQRAITHQYTPETWMLVSWIESLRKTRNSLAHQMRVYGARYGYSPAKPRRTYHYRKSHNNIFDQIYLLRQFYFDDFAWIALVDNLTNLIEVYRDSIDFDVLGFPEEWKRILIEGK